MSRPTSSDYTLAFDDGDAITVNDTNDGLEINFHPDAERQFMTLDLDEMIEVVGWIEHHAGVSLGAKTGKR